MKKGTFGEPWRECPHTGHVRAAGKWDRKDEMPYGFDLYMEPRVHDWPTIRNRIVTCVNACDGIDTDKIQPLMDAVRELVNDLERHDNPGTFFKPSPETKGLTNKIRAMIGGQHD